jgi:hypothetical protein
MKAVISHRIYMDCTDELRDKISKELTYIVPPPQPNDPPIVIKNMQRIRKNLISIPVGRVDLIPDDYEVVDKRSR